MIQKFLFCREFLSEDSAAIICLPQRKRSARILLQSSELGSLPLHPPTNGSHPLLVPSGDMLPGEEAPIRTTTKYVHIKSTTVYARRRNWDFPQPPTRRLVCPLPPVSGGRGPLAGEKGVGRVPMPTRGIHCGTLYMYVLCGIDTVVL